MGLLDWMSTPPAQGGYMDQMVNYGMQFGGPQFGISPDQRTNYFKQQELANNLRYQQENPNDQAGIAMRTGQMGQFLAGQQALERQQQGQHWEAQNMSLAQKTSLDQQSQQRKWEQERRSFEWSNLSAGQQAQNALGWAGNAVAQGNLGVAQAGLGLRQQEMMAGRQPAAPAGYMWTPQGSLTEIPGGAQYQAKQAATNVLQGSVNQLADIRSQVRNDGTMGIQGLSGDTAAVQNAFTNAALPIISKAVMGSRTDAPGESDLKRINDQALDITKMFQSPRTRDKAITMIMEMASQQHGTPLKPVEGESPYFKTYRSDTGRSKMPANVVPYDPYKR